MFAAVAGSDSSPLPTSKRLTGVIHLYGGDFFAVSRSEWNPEHLVEGPDPLSWVRSHPRDQARSQR
jgi:hypothetical protein